MQGSLGWFLTAPERDNPGTRIDTSHPGGIAWTDGNSVTPLVHGRTYFSRLAQELRALGPGDRVLLLDWRADADERMDGLGSEIGRSLSGAAARGADVRGLIWRSHPDEEKFSEQENAGLAEQVNGSGGELLLDERVKRLGSHHQKMVLIRRQDPSRDVAFVGGIDLSHGRNDDEGHRGDPQAIELDARYGPTPAWHDVQLELRGPAVGDLARTFRERWEDPAPLDHVSVFRRIMMRRSLRSPHRPKALPQEPEAPPPAGEIAVQVLRTYPSKRPPFPFAPRGERSVALAYAKVFARARSFIYIEDQYLWSREVAKVLADALRREPGLRLIAVVPRFPDRDGRVSGPIQRVSQIQALELVTEAGGDRVAIYDLENELGFPIYVHAKVCIVDDLWMTIGSDNLNLRSWTHDSELSCAMLDPALDDREPRQVGGGDRARVLPRQLRLQLWHEHLGGAMDDEDLLDPGRGFDAWRRVADGLDGWHRAGTNGPRPVGRARHHQPEPLPLWTRPWAGILNRLGADPDGRPRDLRHARRF